MTAGTVSTGIMKEKLCGFDAWYVPVAQHRILNIDNAVCSAEVDVWRTQIAELTSSQPELEGREAWGLDGLHDAAGSMEYEEKDEDLGLLFVKEHGRWIHLIPIDTFKDLEALDDNLTDVYREIEEE
jgi:hypothetical protein